MDKEYVYIVQCTYFDENGHMFVMPLYATTSEEKALEKVIAKKSQLERLERLAELVAYSDKEVSMSRLNKACTILDSIASIKYMKVMLNRHDTTKDLLTNIEHLISKVQNLLDKMNRTWSSDDFNDNAVNYRWMVHNLDRLEIKIKTVAKFISTHLEKIYKPPRNSYDYRNEDSPEARFNRLYKDKLDY